MVGLKTRGWRLGVLLALSVAILAAPARGNLTRVEAGKFTVHGREGLFLRIETDSGAGKRVQITIGTNQITFQTDAQGKIATGCLVIPAGATQAQVELLDKIDDGWPVCCIPLSEVPADRYRSFTTLYVCPSGGLFQQIGHAIHHANRGDIIIICPGTYYENLEITKSVTLKGVSRKPVIIIPKDPSRVTIFIKDASVKIEGVIEITDGFFGIWVEGSAHAEIRNCTLRGNSGAGIGVTHSAHAVIENNFISGNGFGIFANVSAHVDIIGNRIQRNDDSGIAILDSARATIQDNVVRDNGRYGIEASADQVDVCSGNNVSNNQGGDYSDEELQHRCSG